ncbi:LOW QUALITY PROTEIN: poly(U)-specific endoribonuclease-D-like [Branchiostoma floridae]|uniref:Uridylate-specific endoribonuclease n=1 Tax=Branchiostoma floridae TaxID=7739 RepID=A0A9J7MQZ6_BRAFL|nr:LOW QUALITY PROTEIN: poly(U)-specific endoribonuclease-D-like [Branchiostoma floridae]
MSRIQALLAILLIARHVEGSCRGRCGEDYDRSNPCHCNSRCQEFNNCCSDYKGICLNWGSSCANGRCWERMDPAYSCQCNSECARFGDCCADYGAECLGEKGSKVDPVPLEKDGAGHEPEPPKSEGDACVVEPGGDACVGEKKSRWTRDAENVVEPVSPGTGATSTGSSVSGKELSCLAQLLWDGDVNRASSSQYTLNLQGKIARHELDHHEDQASANLFTYMDEATLFAKDTYSAYVALIDNYVARTGTHEEVTSQETAEINAFLDVIQGTDVIIKLHEFLANKGLTSSDMATFMADLKEMWFGLYSRSGGRALDSSGFEHVFLGEFKRGKVSGFHNWITAYLLEKDGLADYYGYIWDKEPGILAAQLRWGSLYKDLGSMFYGTSPEFDLAMYTMCYVTNPDRLCRFDMADASVAIQTWSWGKSSYGDGKKYLASAYPA